MESLTAVSDGGRADAAIRDPASGTECQSGDGYQPETRGFRDDAVDAEFVEKDPRLEAGACAGILDAVEQFHTYVAGNYAKRNIDPAGIIATSIGYRRRVEAGRRIRDVVEAVGMIGGARHANIVKRRAPIRRVDADGIDQVRMPKSIVIVG